MVQDLMSHFTLDYTFDWKLNYEPTETILIAYVMTPVKNNTSRYLARAMNIITKAPSTMWHSKNVHEAPSKSNRTFWQDV
jgi:hypothetical protein